jgi:hypothetical protein
MRHDEFDRILSEEEEILPSFGFGAAVMDAVRHEAAVPAPIPFPWRRALPGLAATALSLVSVLVVALTQMGRGLAAPPLPAEWTNWLVPMMRAMMNAGAGWVALALLLTLASVMLSMRLASGRT